MTADWYEPDDDDPLLAAVAEAAAAAEAEAADMAPYWAAIDAAAAAEHAELEALMANPSEYLDLLPADPPIAHTESHPTNPTPTNPTPRPTPPPPRRGRHPGARESAQIRNNRALELRMAGATFQQIAVTLGFSDKRAAHRAVTAALQADDADIASTRDEYRHVQLAQLENLMAVWYPLALEGVEVDGYRVPNVRALDAMLKVMERQAKLLGLDAPTRHAITPGTAAAVHSMIDDLSAMFDDLDARQQREHPDDPPTN